MTPFDPRPMPGADERAKRLEVVASAIAQAKLLSVYAQVESMHIDMAHQAIQPTMPGKITENERLNRLYRDLETLRGILKTYLDGLIGWQRGEKQQHQANLFNTPPPEVMRYVQSIKDGVPYVAPTHTGG